MRAAARDIDTAEIARLARVYPRAFGRPLGERACRWILMAGALGFMGYCLFRFDVTPQRIWGGIRDLGVIAGMMFPPSFGGAERELFRALLESLAMAFVGTLAAAIIALPIGIMGARNVIPHRVFHFVLRRHFDAIRGIDPLVWALVYVRAVGMGPIAGTLAIATSDIGTLAKLYAEAIETAERKQVEGVRATGAPGLIVTRLGVLPQVLPVMLANTLYMFESNTRSATILGIVGAGGIGFQLSDRIRAHRWDEVSMIIIMIIGAVALIDLASHALRRRFTEGGRGRPLVRADDGAHPLHRGSRR